MSILKSILHRWNKENKSYDTLHPETEVAQITDFADGIVSKLAATTAISAISALQTDSWFGKMMKWVLDASGVKYLIDTNGYVCFGSLFGGLIIQWGVNITSASSTKTVNYPLAYNRIPVVIPAHFQDVGASADIQAGNATMTGFDVRIAYVDNRTQSTLVADKFTWVSIGK